MVYVDNMNAKIRDWICCNMVADADWELIAMGDEIGLKREWVKTGMYRDRLHFEVALSKKKLAIKAGALEVSMVHLMTMFTVNVPDEELSVAELHVRYMNETDIKGPNDITVKVGELCYCIPNYCLVGALGSMPDSFYPCNKYEWADHPVYFTTVEMVKEAIGVNPDKFKAFIIY